VICPYCGREIIQPEARFCDGCGIDLSNFWKTVGPLLQQLSAQQTSQDEQTEAANAPESVSALARAPPENNFQLPDETPGHEEEAASKSAWSFFTKYFAVTKKRAEESARSQVENRCRACGYNNHFDAAFCRGCGTPLAKSVSPQPR
jgi:hypothetical protein